MIDRACISISGHCNLNCSYCHFRCHGEGYEDVTLSNAKIIIDNIANYVRENKLLGFKVGLLGAGEPLLRFELIKDILEYASHCETIKFYTITNGTKVKESMLDFFATERNRINLNYSLDGYQELHDLFRKERNGKGTFKVVMDSINSYEMRIGSKPIVNCTVNAQTFQNRFKVFSFFKENGFSQISFSRMIGAEHLNINVSTMEFDRFLNDAMKEGFEMRQLTKAESYDCTIYGCRCGVGRTNIFYSGENIYPCGRFVRMDDYILARYDAPLREVESKMIFLLHGNSRECFYETNVERDVVYERALISTLEEVQ